MFVSVPVEWVWASVPALLGARLWLGQQDISQHLFHGTGELQVSIIDYRLLTRLIEPIPIAEPGVWAESTGNITDPVGRSGRKEPGITCIRNSTDAYLNIINLDQGYFVRFNLYNTPITSSSIVKPSKFSAN